MGLGDFTKMLGQMQQVQGKLKELQEQLQNKTTQASSGGGMVTAKVNGKGDLIDLNVDSATVDVNDIEMLEDLIKAAVNAAVAKSRQEMKQEMAKLTGGLNLPGLDELGKLLG